MIMDYKKWLLDNYTFFEDIVEFEGSYFLEFCLKEDAICFVKLCCDVEVSKFNCIFLKQTYKNYMKINYQIMILKSNFYIKRSVVS